MIGTQMIERLSTGGSCVLSQSGRALMSGPSVTDSDGVPYYGQAWLRKATDIGGGKIGNTNQSRKRSAATGLFFDFGDGRSTTTISIISLNLSHWQMMGRRMVGADRLNGVTAIDVYFTIKTSLKRIESSQGQKRDKRRNEEDNMIYRASARERVR